MDKNFSLDSHKLYYHFERVAEFQKSGDCYPLYMEVSPVGLCNHRCIFCAYDYIDYPNRHLEKERFLSFLDEASSVGVKSILFAGEGEPLIHKNIAEFVSKAKAVEIDCGMYSNGELLSQKLIESLLPNLTFLRFSFNGGDSETYARIHKPTAHKSMSGGGALMDKVLRNISNAVRFKKDHGLEVDLGAQFVLLKENKHSLVDGVVKLKESGLDFVSVKPFVFQNEGQMYCQEQPFMQEELKELIQRTKEYEDHDFKVIFRENAFKNTVQKRGYQHCYGCNFITVLNSAGELATCLPYWDKKEFVYGNIYEDSFQAIWQGEKRKRIKEFLENSLDCQQCPANCRPHAINEFLQEILEPTMKHVNFI